MEKLKKTRKEKIEKIQQISYVLTISFLIGLCYSLICLFIEENIGYKWHFVSSIFFIAFLFSWISTVVCSFKIDEN